MSRDSLQSVVETFSCHSCHTQNLLLVDLRDFFSDLGSRRRKKALKMTIVDWPVDWSFSELFLYISRTNTQTSKVTNSLYKIVKHFIIFLKSG